MVLSLPSAQTFRSCCCRGAASPLLGSTVTTVCAEVVSPRCANSGSAQAIKTMPAAAVFSFIISSSPYYLDAPGGLFDAASMLTVYPAQQGLVRTMKRVLTAVILVPLVLLLVFKAPFWLITLAAAAVAALAVWEFLVLADATGAKTPRIAVLIGVIALFACIFFRPEYTTPLLGCLTFAFFILCSFLSPLPRVLPDTAYSVFGLLYVGLSLTTIPLISAQENGSSLLVFLFFVVWTGDIVALYVGRAFGKKKLAPSISPNKTWEGSVGSVLGSLLITLVLIFLAEILTRHGFDWIAY